MNYTLLKQKQFRNFFISDIISGFGVGLTTVGANWYVLSQTNSDSIVGTFLAINVLAGFLISPVAGYITDKFVRRNVIIFTFLVRAIPIGLIALGLYLFKFNLLSMYALAAITGIGWVTYMAASRSYIQSIVPKELLGNANSFIEVSLQVGMFLAGGLSGFLLRYVGFITILVINILLFGVAILLMFKSPIDNFDKEIEKNSLNQGSVVKYLLTHKLILLLGILSILPLLVTQLFNVSMPGYVSHILHASSIVYGMTDMFYGIGGLVAGLITAKLLEKFNKKNLLINFFLIASLALIALFIFKLNLLTFFATFLIGLSNSALRVVINTVLMNKVTKSYMGRTTAIWTGGAQFIEIFSSSYIGKMNDKFGSNYGFLFMFFIMLIGLISSFLLIKQGLNDD